MRHKATTKRRDSRGNDFLSRARLFAARGLPTPQNQNAPRQHDDRRDDCDQLNPPSPSRGVPAFIGHADEFFEKWPIRSSSPLKAYLGAGKLDRRPWASAWDSLAMPSPHSFV